MERRHPIGTFERPLRVAIVGAGPAGFYAAAALFKASGVAVTVDLFDRLPTPYGLVRGGVAPDHQRIKGVVKAYERTAEEPGFRYFGNVHVGRDVSIEALRARYDAVVLSVGAESDRRLGIPGEELDGSYSATEFVGWYNGHPDFEDRAFDLARARSVVVVGVGNVAVDVARVLAQDPERLAPTDITDAALEALRRSAVTDLWVLGRRGPAQAKFSAAELIELAALDEVDLIVRAEDVALDPASEAWLQTLDEREQRPLRKNLQILSELAARGARGARRRIHLRMLTAPVAIEGDDGRVSGVRVRENRLVADAPGAEPWAEPAERELVLPASLVFRAVGYRGVPVPGVPFDARRGVVPNADGRVVDPADGGRILPGLYVAGWAKRGPSGLIGTNRADAVATIEALLADQVGRDAPYDPDHPAATATWVRSMRPEVVTLADWRRLDALERAAGASRGKVRHKFTSIEAALEALRAE